MLEVKLRAGGAARWRVLFPALALIGFLASGCATSSDASNTLLLDSKSDQAGLLLGTSLDRNLSAPKDGWFDRPHTLLTHWQQYNPRTQKLVPGGTRITSLRENTIWAQAPHEPIVQVLQVEPGAYALVGVTIYRTITTFFPLKDGNFHRDVNPLAPLASEIEMEGEVKPSRNFVFSVSPGQVAYLGHFDFIHAGDGSHRIVNIKYSQDAAAARETLKDFPGIKGDMLIMNLKQPTETASR